MRSVQRKILDKKSKFKSGDQLEWDCGVSHGGEFFQFQNPQTYLQM